MANQKKFTIIELTGKNVLSSDNVIIGQVTKIINQPEAEGDDNRFLCDVKGDFFQIVVKLSPKAFQVLKEPIEILFSSQTIANVSNGGFTINLSKQTIEAYLHKS